MSLDPLRNLEAEKTVLGCCFHNPQTAAQVIGQVHVDDFSLSAHQTIFRGIAELTSEGITVDDLVLGERLGNSLAAIGGYSFLATLTDGQVLRRDVSPQIEQIKQTARRRKLYNACNRTMLACADPADDTEGCFSMIGESILEIQADSKASAQRLGDFLHEVLLALKLQSLRQGLVGMATGIDGLDQMTTGIRPGELWVVGALPGRGKTALGAQIALANTLSGIPAVVFSLEMTRDEIASRLLAARSDIPGAAAKIRKPQTIRNEQWPELEDTAKGLTEIPLWLDDSPSLTIQELLARARLYIRRHQVALVVVDYLRLVQAPGRELRERVGNIADALRQLAKTEQVGVVLLSQLRRPDGGLNERPTMIEFKESGDVEAHAHVALLIYIPVGDDGRPTGESEIIVGKQRNGPIGSLPVYFSENKLQFFDRVPSAATMAATR